MHNQRAQTREDIHTYIHTYCIYDGEYLHDHLGEVAVNGQVNKA